MKSIVLLLFALLFVSCNTGKGEGFSTEKVNDSIQYFLLESQDLKLPSANRLTAINRALKIPKDVDHREIFGQLVYQKSWLLYTAGHYDSLISFHRQLVKRYLEDLDSYHAGKQFYLIGYYYAKIADNPERAFQNYTLSKGYKEQKGHCPALYEGCRYI